MRHPRTGCLKKAQETPQERPTNQVPTEKICEAERTTKSLPANSWGRADNQVPTEQTREAEWRTKSLPSNPTRQSGWPSPCRATSQGGADDQVPTQQTHEVKRTIKSLPSNLARRRGRPSPCRATARGGADNQLHDEQPREAALASVNLTSVREGSTQWYGPTSGWQDESPPNHVWSLGMVSKGPEWTSNSTSSHTIEGMAPEP